MRLAFETLLQDLALATATQELNAGYYSVRDVCNVYFPFEYFSERDVCNVYFSFSPHNVNTLQTCTPTVGTFGLIGLVSQGLMD